MIKKTTRITLILGVLIVGFLIWQFFYNMHRIKPVIKYNDQFFSFLMNNNRSGLELYAKSYPGKELFFNEKLQKIDSVFGKISNFDMLKVRKTFSNVFYTTYSVDFVKAPKSTVLFQIIEDTIPPYLKFGFIDIDHKQSNQYISIRPLRDKL